MDYVLADALAWMLVLVVPTILWVLTARAITRRAVKRSVWLGLAALWATGSVVIRWPWWAENIPPLMHKVLFG
jgi:hypothetical protein